MLYNSDKIQIEFFGESHSETLGFTLYGIEKDIAVDIDALQKFIDRRKSKLYSTTSRIESDKLNIKSGIVDGKTDGNPVCIFFYNENIDKKDYSTTIPRPSTSDLPTMLNNTYKTGSGAYSGRMTLAIVAVGGILMQLLNKKGIYINSQIFKIGKLKNLHIDSVSGNVKEKKNFLSKAIKLADKTKKDGDSLGGIIECSVVGLPVGVGGAMFDGLEGIISKSLYAIPSVKGVEFGSGFSGASKLGSQNNDDIIYEDGKVKTRTNNAGGILGGVSFGMPITLSVAFKPIPSILKEQTSVDLSKMEQTKITVKGRHDSNAVLRSMVIVESCVAIALFPLIKENDTILSKRSEIDLIDKKIADLIDTRLNIAKEIGKLKKSENLAVENKERENEILLRLKENHGENYELLEKIYNEIFKFSKEKQK